MANQRSNRARPSNLKCYIVDYDLDEDDDDNYREKWKLLHAELKRIDIDSKPLQVLFSCYRIRTELKAHQITRRLVNSLGDLVSDGDKILVNRIRRDRIKDEWDSFQAYPF